MPPGATRTLPPTLHLPLSLALPRPPTQPLILTLLPRAHMPPTPYPCISPVSRLHLACISPISQFSPDLVLVSCGFDAAAGDPLGGMTLTLTLNPNPSATPNPHLSPNPKPEP